MKPRAVITTKEFRIVRRQYSWCVEKADGHDAMGVRRWVPYRVGNDQYADGKFREFAEEVGRALALRRKRRRKS